MKRITGNDDIAFGHFGTLGYVLSGWIGSVCAVKVPAPPKR